jgi:predicted TIM-barrel fold metal-dependent hydrolase
VVPLGWHLVFHVDAGALADERKFLAALDCPFVIDHMARLDAGQGVQQPAFAQLLELAALPNCFVKISAADRMTDAATLDAAVPFMAALAAAAPARTLWGTDWPHPNSRWIPDDGDLADLLARAVPDAAARHAILVDNPRHLYPLSRSH